MKKREDKINTLLLGLAIGAAIMVVLMFIVISAMPTKRNSTAAKYDLECVAGRSKHPLQECKE